MSTRTPPQRPSIETEGVSRWLARRNISYEKFKTWVGDDPDRPIVSKARLAEQLGTTSRGTVLRLLKQFKREQA